MNLYYEIMSRWQSFQLVSFAEMDRLLKRFNILFIYHSGKLENDQVTYQTTREIFETGTAAAFPEGSKTLFWQKNQKLCYEYLREKILARDDMDTSLLLDVHRILTSGTYDEPLYATDGERPGAFKKHDYVTGLYEVGAPAREVEEQLDKLMEEVNGYCGPDLLGTGAYLHARFENIRPFAEGNGRTGRILLNYFFLTRNHPPLIIFSEDRARYLECLTIYDREHDLTPLTEFLRQEIIKTWAEEFFPDRSASQENA